MRFMYLRNIHGHPVAVLCTSLIRAGHGNIKADMVAWTLSICNPIDRFNKETGKSLAAGRLYTQMPQRLMLVEEGRDTKRAILEVIHKDRRLPKQARDGARLAMLWQLVKRGHNMKRGPKQTDTPTLVNTPPANGNPNPYATGCPDCDRIYPSYCERHKDCVSIGEIKLALANEALNGRDQGDEHAAPVIPITAAEGINPKRTAAD